MCDRCIKHNESCGVCSSSSTQLVDNLPGSYFTLQYMHTYKCVCCFLENAALSSCLCAGGNWRCFSERVSFTCMYKLLYIHPHTQVRVWCTFCHTHNYVRTHTDVSHEDNTSLSWLYLVVISLSLGMFGSGICSPVGVRSLKKSFSQKPCDQVTIVCINLCTYVCTYVCGCIVLYLFTL